MPASTDLASAAKSLSDIYRHAGKTTSTTEEQQIIVSKRFVKWIARPLLHQMSVTENKDTPVTMLDLACGSGVVTQEVQDILPKGILEQSKFIAADNSGALVDLVKKRIVAEEWVNTTGQVLDAMNTELPDNSFSHVAISMGLHLISKPDDVLQDCRRILKPGGIFGSTTPHNDPSHSMWQPDIRSAFASFPFDVPFPENFPSQVHKHGNWADPNWVETHLQSQGFREVEARVCRGTYHVESVDDFLMAFGGMLAWVMSSWWSKETREAHPLEEVRELTRKHLDAKYEGKGWDMRWAVVCATGRVQK